jgi:hypothetical protein
MIRLVISQAILGEKEGRRKRNDQKIDRVLREIVRTNAQL